MPERLSRIAQLLARLPGVGEKTAQRYALFLATSDEANARELGRELSELRDYVRPCERCGNIAEVEANAATSGADAAGAADRASGAGAADRASGAGGPARGPAICAICRDNRRDASLLCVVARVQDLLAIERSGAMRGRYFVLGKLLSPLEGVGAEELPLDALKDRLLDPAAPVAEVLVATPPSVDGEATALLIARELGAVGIKVSRIASGVPHGGDLEFADQVTLGRAIEGRKTLG